MVDPKLARVTLSLSSIWLSTQFGRQLTSLAGIESISQNSTRADTNFPVRRETPAQLPAGQLGRQNQAIIEKSPTSSENC
jgi:hypothetical protein